MLSANALAHSKSSTLKMTKKSIILVNINAPYELKPATLVLASEQRTSTVHQILTYATEIVIRDLLADTEERFEMNQDTFLQVFNKAHTVIIPDSMFVENSRIFETKSFCQYGHEALQTWYHQGGTVFVQCIEGALAAGNRMNELFQTHWKLSLCDQNNVAPTDMGLELLGPFAPKSCKVDNLPYLVECDDSEGLYKVPLVDRKTFEKDFYAQDEMFERLGIEQDSSLTCFDVDKSWKQYLEKYTSRYLIAFHKSENGAVIWFGDRGHASSLSFVFCKLLHVSGAQQSKTAQLIEPKVSPVLSARFLTWLIVSWSVVVFAIFLKFTGMRSSHQHRTAPSGTGVPPEL